MTLVAFDTELRRPACVLVAAALGADTVFPLQVPSETWLLTPTPAMRVYDLDDATFARLVETVTKERRCGE